ncbi:MAG: glycosyltransferase family 39 protein [Candidatus Omnitrophica bacterium]|nr:glycosyltransferase family 39 protein [Candidatus Omnitrophota bacterium]
MSKNKHYFLYAVIAAVIIKLLLFAFAEFYTPDSKIEIDSPDYLKPAAMMASNGVFATKDGSGVLKYEVLRTPGYPLFLAIFHNKMNIPLSGIVFLQIALTILAALIVYKTAASFNSGVAFLSMVIILYEPPIAVFSQIILTEALFLFLMSLFMLEFTRYLKYREIKTVVSAALILVAAAYVRPIVYYLGAAMAIFMIYANVREDIKKGLIHAMIFFVVVYSLLGAWQIRNYVHCGEGVFSSISQLNTVKVGLIGSYAKNTDTATLGMTPIPYYLNVSFRCLMSIMTRPGTFKYFHSDILTVAGKIFAYPWMIFWLTGFIAGIASMRRNIYLQSYLFIILYFLAASIINIMWLVSERFRVPMMPFIAIISAYGWINLISLVKLNFGQKAGV